MFTGGLEIGFLLFVAFLLFGPKKLPEIARVLGKGMAELRRASNELKFSLEEEIRNLDRPDYQGPSGFGELRRASSELKRSIQEEISKLDSSERRPEDLNATIPDNGRDHTEAPLATPDVRS